MGTVPNNIIDNIDYNIDSGEADASDTQKAKVKLTLEGEEEKEKVAPKEKDPAEREQEFRLAASIYNATYGEQLVKEFCDYWTEPTTGGRKLRWEMQKTWDLKRRLATWYANEQKFYNRKNNAYGKNTNSTGNNWADRDKIMRRINELAGVAPQHMD